jgi:uncharacterized protein (DUF1330 family)
MPAYWVARSRITDPVEYKKYTDCVPLQVRRIGCSPAADGSRSWRDPTHSTASG